MLKINYLVTQINIQRVKDIWRKLDDLLYMLMEFWFWLDIHVQLPVHLVVFVEWQFPPEEEERAQLVIVATPTYAAVAYGLHI